MAYKSILSYGSKVSQVESVYYSPVTVVSPSTIPLSSLYCVLAKNDPWTDENNPPTPTQDQQYIKQFYKKIFAAKYISSGNISPVIKRIDWTSGFTYDFYQDNIDMFAVDSNENLILNFYVKNKYDQVFKCLWNNSTLVNGSYVGTPSTIEPYFQPGSYNTNNIFQSTDGYKWKYIFTVDIGSKVKFMDSAWIPVPVGQNTPNPLATTAIGVGNIDVINVPQGGSGYDVANAVVTVTVTGDGTGATGTATIVNGSVKDVVVTNTGSNYTYASVAITSDLGSNTIAIAPTSPVSGHGYDPVSELGCSHVMLVSEFTGSEGGVIPTDIMYHQIGLLVNPVAKSTTPNPANSAIYKTTTDFVVSPGFGVFVTDEILYQGGSLATATFTATILSFDTAGNVVKLINTTGTPIENAPVFGNVSNTTRTLLSISNPDFITSSGYLTLIENRTGIQRSTDGIEQFKFVLGF
jgi:hypothetical protein